MPNFGKDMRFEEWDRKMLVFLGSRRKDHVWDEANAPGDAPTRLPKATTLETFKTKVKASEEFCDLIGVSTRIADAAIDEDVLDADAVASNREDMAKHKKYIGTWPIDCTEVVSYVRASCVKPIS